MQVKSQISASSVFLSFLATIAAIYTDLCNVDSLCWLQVHSVLSCRRLRWGCFQHEVRQHGGGCGSGGLRRLKIVAKLSTQNIHRFTSQNQGTESPRSKHPQTIRKKWTCKIEGPHFFFFPQKKRAANFLFFNPCCVHSGVTGIGMWISELTCSVAGWLCTGTVFCVTDAACGVATLRNVVVMKPELLLLTLCTADDVTIPRGLAPVTTDEVTTFGFNIVMFPEIVKFQIHSRARITAFGPMKRIV